MVTHTIESPIYIENNYSENTTMGCTDEEHSQIIQIQNTLFSDDFPFDDNKQLPEMLELATFFSSSPLTDLCFDNNPHGETTATATSSTTTNVTSPAASTYLSSDLYISYLLNGFSSSLSSGYKNEDLNVEVLMGEDQSSWSCRRDMDLIEMVSCSKMPHSSNSCLWWWRWFDCCIIKEGRFRKRFVCNSWVGWNWIGFVGPGLTGTVRILCSLFWEEAFLDWDSGSFRLHSNHFHFFFLFVWFFLLSKYWTWMEKEISWL